MDTIIWKRTHVDGIIKRSVLSNGAEDGLMVSSGVDGRELVSAGGEAIRNISGKDTLAISCTVQALRVGDQYGSLRGNYRE